MAQKIKFLKFIETPDVIEYTIRVENIVGLYTTAANTIDVRVAPGSIGSGQDDSYDKIVITTGTALAPQVAAKIVDITTSSCCGEGGSPTAEIAETWSDITTIDVTVDAA